MKQLKQWVLAVTLTLCGTIGQTSCSNDDNPVGQQLEEYAGVQFIILNTDIGSSTDDLFSMLTPEQLQAMTEKYLFT